MWYSQTLLCSMHAQTATTAVPPDRLPPDKGHPFPNCNKVYYSVSKTGMSEV
jgi:hypothetical protein